MYISASPASTITPAGRIPILASAIQSGFLKYRVENSLPQASMKAVFCPGGQKTRLDRGLEEWIPTA